MNGVEILANMSSFAIFSDSTVNLTLTTTMKIMINIDITIILNLIVFRLFNKFKRSNSGTLMISPVKVGCGAFVFSVLS
jgi:hypothetical protein